MIHADVLSVLHALVNDKQEPYHRRILAAISMCEVGR